MKDLFAQDPEDLTLKDFLEFLEPIPEDRWAVQTFYKNNNHQCCCVMGHLRFGAPTCVQEREEFARHLANLLGLRDVYHLAAINDGADPSTYPGATPKERVLNVIRKAMEATNETH